MKWFTLLMGCWLLFLSCLPCGDKQECNIQRETTIAATTNHEQHQHDTDHCSPFCNCSCCAAPVICQAIAQQPTAKPVFTTKKYNIYKAPFCAEISYAIWQPPKIMA